MSDPTDLQGRILQVCRPMYLHCLGGNTLIYASRGSVSVQPLMGDFPDLPYRMKVIIEEELVKESCKSHVRVR